MGSLKGFPCPRPLGTCHTPCLPLASRVLAATHHPPFGSFGTYPTPASPFASARALAARFARPRALWLGRAKPGCAYAIVGTGGRGRGSGPGAGGRGRGLGPGAGCHPSARSDLLPMYPVYTHALAHACRLARTPHEHAHALAHAAREPRCGHLPAGRPFGRPAISLRRSC